MDVGRAMVCSTDTGGRLRAFEGPGIMAFILITSIKLLIVILGITLLDTFRGWITTLLVSFSFSFCFFSLLFTFLFDNFTTSSYFFSLFPEIFTFFIFFLWDRLFSFRQSFYDLWQSLLSCLERLFGHRKTLLDCGKRLLGCGETLFGESLRNFR